MYCKIVFNIRALKRLNKEESDLFYTCFKTIYLDLLQFLLFQLFLEMKN